MKPHISIIMPTYNRVTLVTKALDSILNQTYTNWECIIIDDGSVDETPKTLNEYCKKDNRFQYYQRPKHKSKGANACRNYGFELSKGEYIIWFDSDDVMHPKKLEIQIKDLQSGTYDFSVTQTELFDKVKSKSLGLRSKTLVSENIINDFVNFKCFWLLQSVLWKKSFLLNQNLSLNEALHQAQDYEFHLNVLQKDYKYIANNIVTTQMLIHNSNMSVSQTDNPNKIYSNAFVQKKIISELNEDISEETLNKSFVNLVTFYREAIRRKQRKNAIAISKMLFKCLPYLKAQKISKIDIIKGLVYPFFGVGYKWTKIF